MSPVVSHANASSASPPSVVGAVLVYGNTVFSHDQLLDIYAKDLGDEINQTLLATLRNRFSEAYTASGFLPPAVTVQPDSQFSDLLIVEISEAQIGYLELVPRSGKLAKEVRQVVNQYKFGQPVTRRQTEQLIVQLSAIPNADIDANFVRRSEKSSDLKSAIYDLVVAARPTIQLRLGVSNEGGQILGPDLAYVDLALNRIASLPVDMGVYSYRTVDSGRYELIGGDATFLFAKSIDLTIGYSASRSSASDNFDFSVDTRYVTDRWFGQLRHVLRDMPSRYAEVYFNVIQREHRRERQAQIELNQRLNMVEFGSNMDFTASRYDIALNLSAIKGIDGVGAKHQENVFFLDEVDIGFFLSKVHVAMWLPLSHGLSLRLDLGGQYSNDHLPLSQLFVLGGSSFTRAYEPGEFSGERGVGFAGELRKSIRLQDRGSLVPYAYYGIGRVSASSDFASNEQSAASAGLGLRLHSGALRVYCEADRPLTATSLYKEHDWRVNAGLSLAI